MCARPFSRISLCNCAAVALRYFGSASEIPGFENPGFSSAGTAGQARHDITVALRPLVITDRWIRLAQTRHPQPEFPAGGLDDGAMSSKPRGRIERSISQMLRGLLQPMSVDDIKNTPCRSAMSALSCRIRDVVLLLHDLRQRPPRVVARDHPHTARAGYLRVAEKRLARPAARRRRPSGASHAIPASAGHQPAAGTNPRTELVERDKLHARPHVLTEIG